MKDYPWGKGTPTWTRDATANDSDKSFTVPAGKLWEMRGIHVLISNSATVGNRALQVRVAPDGVNYITLGNGGNVAASATGALIGSFAGCGDDSTILINGVSNAQVLPMMPMILPAGAIIRVLDATAVDAAADDMTVVLHYVEYDA